MRINDDGAPEDAGCRYEEHPVPEEHVDELVVQVDGQYALHGIGLNVHHVLTADLHTVIEKHRFTSTDCKGQPCRHFWKQTRVVHVSILCDPIQPNPSTD